MAKEIEFKHLTLSIPKSMENIFPRKLSQGYIHIEKTKQVRVRLDWMQRKAWMCIKFMDGNTRDEFEVEMDFQEGCELFALCPYKLSKNRRSLHWGEFHLDLDEYENGCLIIEVEVPEHHQDDYLLLLPESLTQSIGENVDGQYQYNNYYFAGLKEEDYH